MNLVNFRSFNACGLVLRHAAALPIQLQAVVRRVLVLLAAAACSSAFALPPEVEADRQMLEAKTAIDAKDWGRAAKALKAAEATGVKTLPDSFDYHLGYALANIEEGEGTAEAVKRLERYLSRHGTKGKYYQDALKYYNNAQTNAKYWEEKKRAFDEQWELLGPIEIKSRKTGLVWQRCNSRSPWDGRRCSNNDNGTEFDERQANDYAKSEAQRTGNRWRLPTPDELEQAAPFFEAAGIQTRTQDVKGVNVVIESSARDKAQGKPVTDVRGSYDRSSKLWVRLVRD